MKCNRLTGKLFLLALLALPASSRSVTITNVPFFLRTVNAPLAGTLKLSTDVRSRVSVSVNDGYSVWTKHFYNYDTIHSVPLFGFKPNRTNEITVTVHDPYRNEFTAPNPLSFKTGPLPSDFPTIVLLTNDPSKMEPGYTLFRGQNLGSNPYNIIVDNAGEVVWYNTLTAMFDIIQRPNGNLFAFSSSDFFEFNLLGEKVRTWTAPANWPLETHGGVPTDHGTILYMSSAIDSVTNFPGNALNPNAPRQTRNVLSQPVVEISATNSEFLNVWSMIDILDPRRVSYLTFTVLPVPGVDWEHGNAVLDDWDHDAIIVSMRHQNAVVKLSRSTGQLIWILGPHENWGAEFQPYLLTPVGSPFEWSYGQHAPMLTPQGTLLVYDNGNYRASPFDPSVADTNNYSRAVEYSINEDTMEVSQVWQYGKDVAESLFTPNVGDADFLPKTGNILITFGNVTYVNGMRPSPYSSQAAMVRIKEVTHEQPATVVFDLALFDYGNTSSTYRGCFTYRSDRIPDLYSTDSQPVQDLVVSLNGGLPHLEFSADPSHDYVVEASTDFKHWDEIGPPVQQEDGEFYFDDHRTQVDPAVFYRVVSLASQVP